MSSKVYAVLVCLDANLLGRMVKRTLVSGRETRPQMDLKWTYENERPPSLIRKATSGTLGVHLELEALLQVVWFAY